MPIDDFDEFMLQMGEAIGFDRTSLIKAIKTNSDQLINQLQEQMLLLNSKTENDEIKYILKPQNDEKQNWNWLDWILKIDETTDNKDKEQLYKKAINVLPNSHQLLIRYAVFNEEKKCFEDAESYFLRAIEVAPKEVYNIGRYAIFLQEQQRFEEAETYFLRAIEVDSKEEYYIMSYVKFLKEQERFEDAEVLIKRLLILKPNDKLYIDLQTEIQMRKSKVEKSN